MDILKQNPIEKTTVYTGPEGQPIISIGRFSYCAGLSYGLIDFHSRITIGSFTSIADNVTFFLRTNHHPEWITSYPFEWFPWPTDQIRPSDPHHNNRDHVTVGSDVWIGRGVSVLPGRTIGDGAIVGANSVVAKDVRPYAVVAGNPGHEIRRRFDDETVEYLLRLRWWTLPLNEIRQMAQVICSTNIAKLRAMFPR